MPEIDIVVPTYNASLWLDDLFNSILSQESPCSYRIIARDDASTDNTPKLLDRWQKRLSNRMAILPCGRNLGMVGNYDALFAATSAPYVMLADPDDVWMPGKIIACASALRSEEKRHGVNLPIAVFTDAEVTDADLRPISKSFWQWLRQNPALSQDFSRLLFDNPSISSTMAVNRALLDLALPLSGSAVYPDWWLAQTACCFGKLVFLRERTMHYRRHSANDSEVPLFENPSMALMRISGARRRVRDLVDKSARHAHGFLNHYGDRIPAEYVPILRAAAEIPSSSFFRKRWNLIRYNLWFGSAIKNAGLLLLV